MRKNSIRVLGIGMVAVVTLLLSSAPSWGDTRLMIDQAANGGLNLTVCNEAWCNVPVSSPSLISCGAPSVDWDSTVNGWVLIGCKDSSPMWTGTVTCNSYISPASCTFTQVGTTPLPTGCSLTYPSSMLISTAPTSVTPCTSYSWSACTNGVMTGTGIPAGCGTGQPLVVSCNSACTSWTYGSWSPATCTAGGIQTRTATGNPSPCVGFPDQPTVQSCPASTCLYTYSSSVCGGTCTPSSPGSATGTCPAAQTGVSPAGCIGGNSTPPQIACNATAPTCTSWTYTAWSPSEATCTAGQTLTRSIVTSSPSGCTGGSPVLSEPCPVGSGSPGSPIQLTFGASTQSRNDTLAPGAEKIYVFTVPAGRTYFSANVSSIDQGTDLNILLEQGSMANIDTYFSDVYNYYASNALWGSPYFKTYPPSVWARMSNSSAGENIYLLQSTSSTNTSNAAAVLPGTYYMLVRNVSTCSTCKANYYVYAK